MFKYRCYLLDNTGRFSDTKVFTAPDDGNAASFAFALFVRSSSHYDRFEVWRQNSLVHAYSRDTTHFNSSQDVREEVSNASDIASLRPLDLDAESATQPISTISPFEASRKSSAWTAALRGLAIVVALTLSWIILFDSGFLKSISIASTQSTSHELTSQLP